MRSLPWYGLISLKYLSLQFLAKCPYLSYNQHSVSVFSSQYNCSTPPFTPLTDCSICRTVVLTIYIYIYIYNYVPWYHAHCRSQCIQQSMNQFSKTQRSVTTVAHDELRWSSVSIKLPHILILQLAKAKCCLSAAAAVCVHSVECGEGVGGIDNTVVGAGLSYLMNRMTATNVRNVYWRNNVANTSSLRLFFLNFYHLSCL